MEMNSYLRKVEIFVFQEVFSVMYQVIDSEI